MNGPDEHACPGCGLAMPRRPDAIYTGYYHTSPECWSVFTEVLGAEFGNAIIDGHVHQLTVDSYAVQHAGGAHPDKSIAVHLAGLHLVLVTSVPPPHVPSLLHRLANRVVRWPHFDLPRRTWNTSVFDVAIASSPREHIEAAERWSREVWDACAEHHGTVARFVTEFLGVTPAAS